jgi:endonuclease-3
MNNQRAVEVILRLKKLYPVGFTARSPFHALISAMLSHRTKDEVTERAGKRLLEVYPTPEALAQSDVAVVEELIHGVGFYNVKARRVVQAARLIVEEGFPDTMEELLTLPGVGRKTASCVLSYGFGQPAVAVDVHVHRICNRIGLVRTSLPDESEAALKMLLPVHLWSAVNEVLVPFGKHTCKPRVPQCKVCVLVDVCEYYRG